MIYFDNSATTKINPTVLETYNAITQEFFANPSSLHGLGQKAFNLLSLSRKQIAQELNVEPDEIFFTSGGTESDNWAIIGTAGAKHKQGKHIISTQIEHPAVKNTLEYLKGHGFEVTYLPVDKNGRVSANDLEKAIRDDTILVSVMAINNEIGAIQPINELSEVLSKFPRITFHVDGVQAVAKESVPQYLNKRVDLISFSSHKFHGPRGVGILYKKHSVLLDTLLHGGGQEGGIRNGTENTPAIGAMTKAFRMAHENKIEKIRRQTAIRDYLISELSKLDDITIFTQANDKFSPHVICFAMKGVRGETVVHALEEKDIYISTTSACSSKKQQAGSTLLAMKTPMELAKSAVRISLDEDNTLNEAHEFISAFKELHKRFQIFN